jgi:adenosylhomocysteine nucleosidase
MNEYQEISQPQVIGIIGAMQVEIDLLLQQMVVIEEKRFAGFPFVIGHIEGRKAIITRCGVGKTNAACCTQILIDKFQVTSIIHTGIAGSLRHDVGIGDIVISSDVTHHDVARNQMKHLFPFQETFLANSKLIELARTACPSVALKSRIHVGRIVSGECFVSDAEVRDRIISLHSPHCVEMEGAAIGHVAHINQVPFVVIRSISDNADEAASNTYESFEEIAAQQSASIVIEMISRM